MANNRDAIDLMNEVARLTADLAEANRNIKVAHRQQQEAAEDALSYRNERDTARAELAETRLQRDGFATDIDRWAARCEGLRQELAEARTAYQQELNAAGKYSAEADAARQELARVTGERDAHHVQGIPCPFCERARLAAPPPEARRMFALFCNKCRTEHLTEAVWEKCNGPRKRARCGHVAYRGHDEMCIEDGCPDAAYQVVVPREPPEAGGGERDMVAELQQVINEAGGKVTFDSSRKPVEPALAERCSVCLGMKTIPWSRGADPWGVLKAEPCWSCNGTGTAPGKAP